MTAIPLEFSVLYQLRKIYGSKRPGHRLFSNFSGCAIAQRGKGKDSVG